MDHRNNSKRRKLDNDDDSHFSVQPSRSSYHQKHAINRFRDDYRSSSRAATPRDGRHGSTPRQQEFDGPEAGVAGDDVVELDRDWYAGDENGNTLGDEITTLSAETSQHGRARSENRHSWRRR